MEAIFLDCGAGGPQLKRNPLDGGMNFQDDFDRLRVILKAGIDEPAELAQTIRRFLTAYDALPDEIDAQAGA